MEQANTAIGKKSIFTLKNIVIVIVLLFLAHIFLHKFLRPCACKKNATDPNEPLSTDSANATPGG